MYIEEAENDLQSNYDKTQCRPVVNTPMTMLISDSNVGTVQLIKNNSWISQAHSAPLRNNNDNNDTQYKILLYRQSIEAKILLERRELIFEYVSVYTL